MIASPLPKKGADVRKWVSCVVAATLFVAGPANAAWYKASSKHFVIFANDNPKRLHDFGENLERFAAHVRSLPPEPKPAAGRLISQSIAKPHSRVGPLQIVLRG